MYNRIQFRHDTSIHEHGSVCVIDLWHTSKEVSHLEEGNVKSKNGSKTKSGKTGPPALLAHVVAFFQVIK